MDDTLPNLATHEGAHRPPAGAVRPARSPGTAPPQWQRGMTLVATISLFIGTRSAWTRAVTVDPPIAAAISVCYAGILVCGILALSVRGRRAMARVDLGVLIVAIALVVCGYWLNHAGSDEGVLTAQAATEILHGRPVYGRPWPWLFHLPHVGITKTMSGGGDYTYGYPPLTALIAAPVRAVVHTTAAATSVTTAALITGTAVLWKLVPAPWRSSATAVCLGFGLLPGYARAGYPAIVALALLVPAVVRWPVTGGRGRLGRNGVLRACCLGAACAAQQLAWFLAPFLLIGIFAVRRGELGGRAALAVTARYTGLAALTWLLLNGYVAAQGVGAWLSGTLLPITQGAILHGQGVMGISYYFTAGSGRLDFYSYAAAVLLLGLLAALVLFVRRLGPALTVLPWLPFYLATRSQDGYFLLMTPLWLAAVATVPVSSLATAWQPRLPRVRGRAAKAWLLTALFAPAVLCTGVAAASPAPLRLAVAPRLSGPLHRAVTSAIIRAENTTGNPLTPHFASRTGQGASGWWAISSGPATLAPHTSAAYVVTPPPGLRAGLRAGRTPRFMIAVTGTPMTITTTRFPAPVPAVPRSRAPGR